MSAQASLAALTFQGYDLVGKHNRPVMAVNALEEGIAKYGVPTAILIGDETLVAPVGRHVARRYPAAEDAVPIVVAFRRQVGTNGLWLGYLTRDALVAGVGDLD